MQAVTVKVTFKSSYVKVPYADLETYLTTAPAIPASVTDMRYCFADCTKLTDVTLKCDYNPAQIEGNPVFVEVFAGCSILGNGSIKVPTAYYDNYTAESALIAMNVFPAATLTSRKQNLQEYRNG